MPLGQLFLMLSLVVFQLIAASLDAAQPRLAGLDATSRLLQLTVEARALRFYGGDLRRRVLGAAFDLFEALAILLEPLGSFARQLRLAEAGSREGE
jgi:hypothetical protein